MDDALVWEAPARCPAEAKVRAEIAALVRPVGQRPRYQITGRVEDVGGRFTLRLLVAIDGASGERTLSEISCDTLTSAGVAIVALAVNAATEARASTSAEPEPPPPPPASAGASDPTGAPPAEAPPAGRSPPPPGRLFVGAWGAVELGTLPSAQPLFGLLAGYTRPPFAFLVYGAGGPAQRVRPSEVPTASANVSTGVLGIAAFRGLFDLPIGPTVGVSLVRFSGRGEGPTIVARDVDHLMVRAEAGGLASYERGFFGARLAMLATVPLVRPTFVIGDDLSLFRPSRVGGRLEIGLFARF